VDRWGLRWQIAPATMAEMVASPDREAAARVTREFLTHAKLDLAKLEAAFKKQPS
jgi:predicted 3-demethylubiquinone-9 3-methyltransferase (glyoxalase superfamily)